jgi:hypothetical protein
VAACRPQRHLASSNGTLAGNPAHIFSPSGPSFLARPGYGCGSWPEGRRAQRLPFRRLSLRRGYIRPSRPCNHGCLPGRTGCLLPATTRPGKIEKGRTSEADFEFGAAHRWLGGLIASRSRARFGRLQRTSGAPCVCGRLARQAPTRANNSGRMRRPTRCSTPSIARWRRGETGDPRLDTAKWMRRGSSPEQRRLVRAVAQGQRQR